MKYYLVQYYGNYADEFDVYFHNVLSEDQLNKAKEIVNGWEDEYGVFGFGTNEDVEICKEELIEMLDEATPLTDEQYKVLNELGLTRIKFGDCLDLDYVIGYDED